MCYCKTARCARFRPDRYLVYVQQAVSLVCPVRGHRMYCQRLKQTACLLVVSMKLSTKQGAGKNVRQEQAVTARSFRYHEDERRMFSEAFEHFY